MLVLHWTRQRVKITVSCWNVQVCEIIIEIFTLTMLTITKGMVEEITKERKNRKYECQANTEYIYQDTD